MQREIIKPTEVLDERGHIVTPGYAKTMQFVYDRSRVKTPLRLKEWDFYQILHGDWVAHLTIGHVSYMASVSADLLNLRTGEKVEFGRMYPFPLRNIPMPQNPEIPNRIVIHGRDYYAGYEVTEKRRRLVMRADDKTAGIVDIDVILPDNPNNEKMVIATPFDKPNQFYLNYKENYWGAKGHLTIGDVTVLLDHTTTSLIDWGRGVWPFTQEWFWGNATCFLNGEHFGFNIGWGFGDLSHATENMFFYRDKAYKLGALIVERDEADYMKPWHFVSEDGDFDFTMEPIFDNDTQTKVLFVDNRCHQVFGKWNGTVRLPDQTVLEIRDLTAFCEHAKNRW